ncbi:hypothetical protein [Acinetobacter haemolyticus]|uniref:hypothetical protein n=1 Tax=Acinetobacter haemolyticus TaxID=29430 RepID=UPI000D68B25F|nr:hypothetical protein [Acinetobacter haemolyticus]
MKKHIFSYKNNSNEVVNLIIEPWVMIYEIKPLSTIVFTYTSNENTLEVVGFKDSSINIYFEFEEIKVVLDEKDITSQYPIKKLNV